MWVIQVVLQEQSALMWLLKRVSSLVSTSMGSSLNGPQVLTRDCSSMGCFTGYWIYIFMGCRGRSCFTIVFTVACSGISTLAPGALSLSSLSLTFVSAIFFSHMYFSLFQLMFHSSFYPFLIMLSQRCYHCNFWHHLTEATTVTPLTTKPTLPLKPNTDFKMKE